MLLSGSGNVSLYAAQKLLQIGAVVLTLSDSKGYVYEPEGFSQEALDQVGFRVQVTSSAPLFDS